MYSSSQHAETKIVAFCLLCMYLLVFIKFLNIRHYSGWEFGSSFYINRLKSRRYFPKIVD